MSRNNKLENSKSTKSNTGLRNISKRKNGKFEACVRFPANRNNVEHKFHIGTYNKLDEAVEARINFIKALI